MLGKLETAFIILFYFLSKRYCSEGGFTGLRGHLAKTNAHFTEKRILFSFQNIFCRQLSSVFFVFPNTVRKELTFTKWVGHCDFEFIYHIGHKAFLLSFALSEYACECICLFFFFPQVSTGFQVLTSGYSIWHTDTCLPSTLDISWGFQISGKKSP